MQLCQMNKLNDSFYEMSNDLRTRQEITICMDDSGGDHDGSTISFKFIYRIFMGIIKG